jgi:hypothetical protein
MSKEILLQELSTNFTGVISVNLFRKRAHQNEEDFHAGSGKVFFSHEAFYSDENVNLQMGVANGSSFLLNLVNLRRPVGLRLWKTNVADDSPKPFNNFKNSSSKKFPIRVPIINKPNLKNTSKFTQNQRDNLKQPVGNGEHWKGETFSPPS